MPSVLVDTGPLYALADRDDNWHHRTVRFLETTRDDLIVPASVLPEAAYLLLTHLGPVAERQLVQSVLSGELPVEDLTRTIAAHSSFYAAMKALVSGFVDATVMAGAERLKIQRILTTDRRHFAIARSRHCKAFELLP